MPPETLVALYCAKRVVSVMVCVVQSACVCNLVRKSFHFRQRFVHTQVHMKPTGLRGSSREFVQ